MAIDFEPLRFADVAVNYTADQFQGIYRGKQYHAPDFGEVIQRAKAYNCEKMMLTTMNLEGFHRNLQLVREHPETCTLTLGVHPYHAGEIYASANEPSYLSQIRELGQSLLREVNSPLVAFGEIGLDYEYLDRADKETQIRAFKDQLELAVEFQLPLFLHVRESCADFIEIIHVSVNGVCFRTEEQLEMVKAIPLDKLQLETDAPWCEVLSADEKIAPFLQKAREMPPVRKHNKFILGQMVKNRNESCFMERVAMVVAGVKRISVQEVAHAAWKNSVRKFGMPPVYLSPLIVNSEPP
ncbi:hypothetical protein CBS147353_11560 [Aspergillus niger]|nr:hypothetical protein CBS147353_11560 [Aspergillus niger]